MSTPKAAPSAPSAAPEDAAVSTLALLIKNPWIILLLGFTGGGGLGTLLGRPVLAPAAASEALTKDTVQDIVDASIEANNAVLLQKIEILLDREKMRDAGITPTGFAPGVTP